MSVGLQFIARASTGKDVGSLVQALIQEVFTESLWEGI
jgi:hypothetical protein